MLFLFALALGWESQVQALVWEYTNKTSTVWTTANNWRVTSVTPNTNGAPPVGLTNFPGRININASVVYNYATNTGFGTIVNATPEFGRGLGIGNGSSQTGAVEIVTGGLVVFQTALQDAVFVGAPGNGSGTSKGYLTLSGGSLTVVATNYGVVACPFRGSAATSGLITVTNGGALNVDRLRFGGQGGSSAVDVAFGCNGTVYLGPGGTVSVRNMANILNPANMFATNLFDGGTLKVKGAEEGSFPFIGLNITNNILAGGLTVDTAGTTARITSALVNGNGGVDGGLTKIGNATLNLRGFNSTYNGPTIVSAGTLGMQVPMVSTDIRIQPGATNNFITDNTAPWALPSLGLTNVSVGFDYGNFSGYSGAVVAVNNLNLQGSIKVNLLGLSFPVTDLTLLTYTSKTGGGAFTLGTLPSGAAATLEDTGSSLVLHITSASLQSLVWSASVNSNWQTNGAANWNGGTSTYLEYASGSGDVVIFDDTYAGGTVNLPSRVRPASITVDDIASFYTFSGAGGIGGATGLDKSGTSSLTIGTSNDFTGEVTVSGGTLFVNHPNALGATNGGTTVSGSATTLEIGTLGGSGITVSGETVTISGAGVGGALGALRGGATAAGTTNKWTGPVIIGSGGNARIGTEDAGNLTVSGQIKELFTGLGITLRPGAGGVLTLSSPSNNWSGNTPVFGGVSGKLVLGAANALPATGALLVGDAIVDLGGYNQSVAGLGMNGGTAANAVVLNDGGSPSTLTLDPAQSLTFAGSLQNGAAAIAIIKNGTNSQTFSGPTTYSGSTVVNGGTLAVTLPLSSTSLTLADTTVLAVTVANSTWTPATLNATNATVSFNYGLLAGAPTVPLTATTLNVSGSNVVNVAGANLPLGPVTLIAYSGKNGDGSFHLGTLPPGMQATLADTGSAIVLNVTVSPQTRTWYGAATGTWNTNSTLDWNGGAASYQEVNGFGDFVLFDDTAAAFTVSLTHDVRPYSVTVNNPANAYTFDGPGKISGTNGLAKLGTGSLTLNGENNYDGVTTISGGSGTAGGFLYVNHPKAPLDLN